MAIRLAPGNLQIAAIQCYTHLAARHQTAPDRRHRCRTCPGTAGAGDACAALPHPHLQVRWPQHRNHLNIHPFGEQRVVLDHRAKRGQIHRRHILHKKHRVRIAHIHRHRLPQRANRQINRQGILPVRQRDFRPRQPHRPHIHRNAVCPCAKCPQQARAGTQCTAAGALLFHHPPGDAAAGVAAGTDFRAVGIINRHERIGICIRSNHDQLVAPHTFAALGNMAHLCRRQRNGLGTSIQHNKIVAEAMHFLESERLHGLAYNKTVAYMSNSFKLRWKEKRHRQSARVRALACYRLKTT